MAWDWNTVLSDFFLLGIIIFFILNIFIEREFVTLIVTICIVLVTLFLVDQLTYKTISKAYGIDESFNVETITLEESDRIKHVSLMRYQTTIDDEEDIEQIVSNLSEVGLKRDSCMHNWKYTIYLEGYREIKENIFEHEVISFSFDESCLNSYKIVSGIDYLKELMENEDYEWKALPIYIPYERWITTQ